MTTMELADDGMVGLEPARVVFEPGDRGQPLQRPSCPRSPGLTHQVCASAPDTKRRDAIRGSGGKPPAVVVEPPVQGTQGLPQVETAFDRDGSRLHTIIMVGLAILRVALTPPSESEDEWRE